MNEKESSVSVCMCVYACVRDKVFPRADHQPQQQEIKKEPGVCINVNSP